MTKWVSWYKAHRATLIHPIVHIRRADMQSWDGWLHINPFGCVTLLRRVRHPWPAHLLVCHTDHTPWGGRALDCRAPWICRYGAGNTTNPHAEVGVAMLFNPTGHALQETISIPLYYTGLTTAALVSVDGGQAKVMAVERDYSMRLSMTMPAGSIHTVTFARPKTPS